MTKWMYIEKEKIFFKRSQRNETVIVFRNAMDHKT